MTEARAIRTIAVAGGGIVGLSAATAFGRALPGTKVTLVETRPDPAALADLVPTTWPDIARFHAAIGLDEPELVRAGIATPHLGTLFEGWSPSGRSWIHAFGKYGKPAGAIPFDQIWCRAGAAGEVLDYDRYSVAAALARAGKFVHPTIDPESIGSRFQYGLRVDPELYRARLAEQARATNTEVVPGEIARVEVTAERVKALLLHDGRRVEADLFIDCTGPSALLIGSLDDSFEDWSAWMPFDRVVLTSEASGDMPSTADHVRATADGWAIEWPLVGRTLRAMLRNGGEGIAIKRGRRLRPWVGNVLAIGDAATALDPLHGMNIATAQQAILLALELLPGRDFNRVETEEYNRRAEQLTRRVRDFLVLHYLRSGRASGTWADLARAEPPESLARTLDQYQYRGRLPFFEEESISRDSWTAALIGLRVLPAHIDPQAAAVPLDTAVPAMRRLAREIDETVARLPSYREYLGGRAR